MMSTDEAAARRLRRIAYRAGHRGTREMDFLLGRFADARLAEMKDGYLALFESLLEEPDPLIGGWILDADADMPPRFKALVDDIRCFHGLNPKPPLA